MLRIYEKDRNLLAWLSSIGIPAPADIQMVTRQSASTDYAPYSYFRDKIKDAKMHGTIAEAYAATETGRNDVVLLSPDSHSQSAEISWARNMTHLIGMYPTAMMNQRSRIGQSAAMASILNVTGYGNLFKNLYFMWGNGEATSYAGVKVTGNRNTFENCHLGGPFNATEGAIVHTTHAGGALHLNGCEECYFKNCVIGGDTIERGANNAILYIGGSASDYAMRNIFEDCLFLSSADSGQDALNIYIGAATHGWVLFKNCTFINISASGFANALPVAITVNANTTTTQFRAIFDAKCCFHGYTDIVAKADEANVEFQFVPIPQETTTYTNAEFIGLSGNPDLSTA